MKRKTGEESAPPGVSHLDPNGTDKALALAAQAGDKAAFGKLVRIYQKRLFRFIFGLTGSFDKTEDVVQEAFIKAYGALDRFEPDRAFYPWLSTIARNLAFNLIQRDQKTESLDKIREAGFDKAAGDLGPLEKLLTRENQKRYYSALAELPVEYREVFALRHFEDMNYKEIAAELKIPPGTVDSRLFRARKMLLEALKDLL